MWFGLLGTLQVRVDHGEINVSAAKQRVLLAALLLTPGQAVSAARLSELVWDGFPPRQAAVTLRSYVKRLRQVLGPPGAARIITGSIGYQINATAAEIDIAQFDDQVRMGIGAAQSGDWQRAQGLLDSALALWRGSPLADIPCQALLLAEGPHLEEQRLQALQWRIEASLQLGQHHKVTPQLQALTAAHPLREPFHGQLMMALYRSGRQAEALAAYRTARRIIVTELGLDPGPELQLLHQRILAGDCEPVAAASHAVGQPAWSELALAAPAVGDQVGPAGYAAQVPVPRQLPAPVAGFTGRDAELAALTSQLGPRPEPNAPGPALVISAIGGTAGVGKTALAVQWAHRVAGRFPDGQLYVNLRGYDPDEPVSAADALARFLRDLGVPGPDIPAVAEERAARYRSLLAGRRVLVLLDNAGSAEQVRPLLPATAGCTAIVTSRDALAGLVATDGVRRLDLDVLPQSDAIALLRSLTASRVDEDQDAVRALADLCARLPLALRIAAEQAVARPETSLRELAAELAADRLDGLDAGEDRADVRAVFSWSVRQLPDDVAKAFALIGLHPGLDLDVHAASALTGATAARAARALARLHRASLIQAAGSGRYGMHDLLRVYAREEAVAAEQEGAGGIGGECHQALTRLFDYYLAATIAAMNGLYPAEAHQRPAVTPSAAARVPATSGPAAARAWLDSERENLVAAVVHCAGHGWPKHAAGLAEALFGYLMTGGHLHEAQTIYGHALQAARRSGDLAAEAEALSGLGGVGLERGHFRDAAGHYQAALERYRTCSDRAGEARTLMSLGISEQYLRNDESAAGYHSKAIIAFEDAGDSLGTARALSYLAGVETEMGSYDRAARHLQLALAILGKENDLIYKAEPLERLGMLMLRRGQLSQAAGYFEQALAIYRRIDHRSGVGSQLLSLGVVDLREGRYQQAVSYFQRALTLFRQTGNRYGEIRTLRNLAEALRGSGQLTAARAELQTALCLAAETGNTYQEAGAHSDLAENYHSACQDGPARQHWQQALDLFTQLGAPEADQIRSLMSLATLVTGSGSATGTRTLA